MGHSGVPAISKEEKVIDTRTSVGPVHDAVREAYSINTDNSALRKMASFESSEQPEYFKNLRKNYRARLEFPHYRVLLNQGQKAHEKTLKGLGFKV